MRSLVLFGLACAPTAFYAWSHQASPQFSDRVADLQRRIKSGEAALTYDPKFGYLPSLLKELDIPVESQRLVFSKTSLQSDHISPKTPRALYFNEDTSVGWIPGAPMIEIIAQHPTQGALFYTMPNVAPSSAVAFTRETIECFRCHGGFRAGQQPGHLSRSTFVAPSGYPRPFAPTYNQRPSTPLSQRWGGWYVTGTHGKARHMGNELALGTDEKYALDPVKGLNLTSLAGKVDPKAYLLPHSDIVALMVSEHQMEFQNTLNRVARMVQNLEKRGENLEPAAETLVRLLLMDDEVPISDPIKGTTSFAQRYAARFPRDSQGRSLGDLDLRTRTFRYGVSPMIHTATYRALPHALRADVAKRIHSRFAKGQVSVPSALRQEALDVLAATVPEFAPN